jgi:protocatechuate 3,4-dioxygenase beta subunit
VSSGTYSLEITDTNNSLSYDAPQYYRIDVGSYSLSQSTVLDITIPAKKVTMHIQDQSGNPVSDAEVDVPYLYYENAGTLSIGGGITNALGTSAYGYNEAGPKTDSSGNVTLWLLPNSRSYTYSFEAIPPSGSSYLQTTIPNISVTGDTSEAITFQQPVTLSGHVYGPLGNILASQTISLQPSSGSQINVTTDDSGNYSISAAPGTYTLHVSADNNSLSLNAPQYYRIDVPNYSLTKDTSLDITLPAKKVSFHIQDAAGDPISNAEIDVPYLYYQNSGTLSIGEGAPKGSGTSAYGYTATGPTTDFSGNVTVWLLPNSSTYTYNITVKPPSGSNYQQVTLSNVAITDNTNKTVTLQRPIRFSGHVYDRNGVAVVNQVVELDTTAGSQVTTTTTDSTGSYAMNV